MTPKEEAIREVLSIREKHCQKARRLALLIGGSKEAAAYYEGKADGYMQAFDLLSESLESIEIELQ